LFCDGSVASIFISFSAVIMLNSRFAMDEYVLSLSLNAAMAVPKYRPLSEAAACSVLPAAWAGIVVAMVAPSVTIASADAMRARLDMDEGVIVSPRSAVARIHGEPVGEGHSSPGQSDRQRT